MDVRLVNACVYRFFYQSSSDIKVPGFVSHSSQEGRQLQEVDNTTSSLSKDLYPLHDIWEKDGYGNVFNEVAGHLKTYHSLPSGEVDCRKK